MQDSPGKSHKVVGRCVTLHLVVSSPAACLVSIGVRRRLLAGVVYAAGVVALAAGRQQVWCSRLVLLQHAAVATRAADCCTRAWRGVVGGCGIQVPRLPSRRTSFLCLATVWERPGRLCGQGLRGTQCRRRVPVGVARGMGLCGL
jgi:hypothetical protein